MYEDAEMLGLVGPSDVIHGNVVWKCIFKEIDDVVDEEQRGHISSIWAAYLRR
jgi:hypothetical protein